MILLPCPRLEALAACLASVLLQAQVDPVYVVPQSRPLPKLFATLVANFLPAFFHASVDKGIVLAQPRLVRKGFVTQFALVFLDTLVVKIHVVFQLGALEEGLGAHLEDRRNESFIMKC